MSAINLTELFNTRIFRIPDYQRGYAWEEKQLGELWDDLDEIQTVAKKLFLYFLFLFLTFFSSCKNRDKNESKEEAITNEKTTESKKSQAFSPSDIYSQTKAAIVLIIAFGQNQIPLSQGSGFFTMYYFALMLT